MLASTFFCIAYFDIALVKIPGLIVDRGGIALLGAIAMVVFGDVTIEGIFAIFILIALFFSSMPREFSAIGMAGVLLCSRKIKTQDNMGLVDWHLITLFCALFVIIHGFSQSGYL